MVELVYMAFLVALCVCGYLLIYSPFESPETLEQPALQIPGAITISRKGMLLPWVFASIHTAGWPLILFSRGNRKRFT